MVRNQLSPLPTSLPRLKKRNKTQTLHLELHTTKANSLWWSFNPISEMHEKPQWSTVAGRFSRKTCWIHNYHVSKKTNKKTHTLLLRKPIIQKKASENQTQDHAPFKSSSPETTPDKSINPEHWLQACRWKKHASFKAKKLDNWSAHVREYVKYCREKQAGFLSYS